MGHTNPEFEHELGSILADADVSAYIAGHEHLEWDESLSFGEKRLRQITVGTASGAYTFPLNQVTCSNHCKEDRCALPANEGHLALDPGSCQERDKVTLLMVEVTPQGYATRFLALDSSGQLVPATE